MRERASTIEPKRHYAAQELASLGVFKTKDIRTVGRVLFRDSKAKKPVLKAEIRGEGRQRRYYVLGKNVLAYLK